MILTTSSLKGGVGKTTLSVFLAHAIASSGKRVLVVDLDHNNNATDYFARNMSSDDIEAKSVRNVLSGSLRLDAAIIRQPFGHELSIDFIPATPSLATVGLELSRDPGAILRLRSGLRRLDYDVILIDTPPALTLELTAGLYAADVVLVPISASRWTVKAYATIEEEVRKIEDAIGSTPRLLAIPSMVSDIEAAALRAVDVWTASSTSVPRDPAIRAAASEGRMLRYNTRGANVFDHLAQEVICAC